MAVPSFDPNQYDWTDPANPQPINLGLGGFAAHIANPANIQALAPSLTPPQSVVPPKAADFWDGNSNLLAPKQPQVLPPVRPGQPVSTPPQSNPASWFQPSAQTTQDQAQLRNLQTSGAGVNQVQNKPLRTLGKIGDVAASILLPHAAQFIPGTTAHNLQLQGQQQGRINNDVAADQARAQAVQSGLQAQDTQAQIAQRNAQTAQIPILTRAKQMQAQQMAAQHGLRATFDDNGNQTGFEADPDSPVTQRQQAQNDYFKARQDLAGAQADLAKAKNDPNSAAFKQAQQRVNTAMTNANTAIGRLGLSEKNYSLKAYGTDAQGNPLPGALQTEDGQTVGTAFNKNVAPTGAQRSKGNLAQSADEQLGDIKSIMQKHSTLFGPGYGQTSQFKQWLGSQDPDAQRFLAARTIAADHLAGVFGGRSEAALDALDKAIGQFKDNPQAAIAGVDQLSKANKTFVKAGTVPLASRGALGASAPGGKTYKQTATGQGGHKIGSNDNGKTWFDVKTGKAI